MSKKQIDIYRTGIYLRLSQGDEDIDGLEKKESNSISNQKLLLEGYVDFLGSDTHGTHFRPLQVEKCTKFSKKKLKEKSNLNLNHM